MTKATLPFVSDELITQAGETKMNLERVVRHLNEVNPHLLDYILGFTEYVEVEGVGFNKENVFNFGLSIYELLRRAGESKAKWEQ